MPEPEESSTRRRRHLRVEEIMGAITKQGPLPVSELLGHMTGVTTAKQAHKIISAAREHGVLHSSTRKTDLPKGLIEKSRGPTQFVEIAAKAGHVVGLNIGRTYYSVAVADPNGRLLSTFKHPPLGIPRRADEKRRLGEYEQGQIEIYRRSQGEDGLSLLRTVARKTAKRLELLEVEPETVRGITLGVPAPASTTQSRLLTSSIERPLAEVEDIADTFKRALGTDAFAKLEKLVLANDADVAARGEVRYGNAYEKKDVIVLHAAYGVGAGVICDGALARTGAGGGVGEIGHCAPFVGRDEGMRHGLPPLDPEHHLYRCSCGRLGHLEGLAGGEAIIRRLAAGSRHLSEPPPEELAPLLANPERSFADTMNVLFSAIRDKDPWQPGLEAVLDAAHMLGGGAQTMTQMFKPEAIFVCGKLSEVGQAFLNTVREGLCNAGPLDGYLPVVELGDARSEFGRRLIMVRGAAMTAVRSTEPLITSEDLQKLDLRDKSERESNPRFGSR